jgi:phosphocarrier protein HPr
LSETQISRRELTIGNKLGIHARPAAQFVKLASRYSCDIMGLMMLAAGHGSVLIISAEGPDAEVALTALEDLIKRNFEED